MITIRVLLGLLLFIPLAACAAADNAANCPPHSKMECVKKPVLPRRAVPRIPDRPIPPPPAPKSAVPVTVPPVTVTPPPPAIGSCDAGGCWDAGGNRYNGGANGTYLNGNGRLCQRNGVSMQCF